MEKANNAISESSEQLKCMTEKLVENDNKRTELFQESLAAIFKKVKRIVSIFVRVNIGIS